MSVDVNTTINGLSKECNQKQLAIQHKGFDRVR